MTYPNLLFWYPKEDPHTLSEIQIFPTESEAQTFLNSARTEDFVVKMIPNLRTFVQNKQKNLVLY